MTIRIGANPIGWSNDDMREIGGWIPLDQCLSEAKAAGFEGMEMGNKFPAVADELRPVLSAHGLVLVGGWYSTALLLHDAETEFAKSAGQRALLKGMGTSVFIAAECSNTIHGDKAAPLSSRPVMTAAQSEMFNARLTRFAELVRAEGFQLVYHYHMGTIIQTPADIDRLMQGTGEAVHLLLDTGHAVYGGDDPVRLAKAYKSRISHIHCKDVRLAVKAQSFKNDWSFLDSILAGVYTVPGDGSIDFVAVFMELSGYGGWVVVEAEQDPEKAPPAVYAKLGYDNLKRFLKEGGLT